MRKDFDQLKAQALAQHLGIDLDGAEQYIDEEKYLVLTDTEANDLWNAELDTYIEDCIIDQLPPELANYFDTEAWKRDARFDGRGHCLANYDGNEHEETIDGETLYIYRQY